MRLTKFGLTCAFVLLSFCSLGVGCRNPSSDDERANELPGRKLPSEQIAAAAPPRRAYQGDPASELVEGLSSLNPAPPVEHDSFQMNHIRFPDEYSMSEQQRVQACAVELLQMREQAFPALIAALDDPRYCWSSYFDLQDFNLTVGQSCRRLLESQINPAFQKHVRFFGPIAQNHILNYVEREIGRDADARRWMEKHRDHTLAQIQAEAVEWAIPRCQDDALYPSFERVKYDLEAMQMEVVRLNHTGVPAPPRNRPLGPCTPRGPHE